MTSLLVGMVNQFQWNPMYVGMILINRRVAIPKGGFVLKGRVSILER